MLNMFYKDTGTVKMSYPKMDYLNTIINSNMDKLNSYYYTSNINLKRPNMLIKLLIMMNIDISKNVHDAYFEINNSFRLAGMGGVITTVKENSEPHTGTIIKDVSEYFILKETTFNYTNRNVESYVPITSIAGNMDQLFFCHPQKFDNGVPEVDYNVYTIDVAMLGMQYYHWCKREKFKGEDLDPGKFLYEVVLTNTIPSIIKVNIFNRYARFLNNETGSKFRNYNPFFITDVDKSINDMFKWHEHNLVTRSLSYPVVVNNLPLIPDDDVYIFGLANIDTSVKNVWAIWLSKLDLILFLLNHGNSKSNKDHIYDIEARLKRDMNDKCFEVDDITTKFLLKDKLKNVKLKIEG